MNAVEWKPFLSPSSDKGSLREICYLEDIGSKKAQLKDNLALPGRGGRASSDVRSDLFALSRGGTITCALSGRRNPGQGFLSSGGYGYRIFPLPLISVRGKRRNDRSQAWSDSYWDSCPDWKQRC